MSLSPRVSIGLPVYNGERFLAEAIESVLEQTFQDWELIISDNGSDDATPDICREYSSRESRIHYFRHRENQGAAWNFNYVAERARGEYFKWAAHDDVLHQNYLSSCVCLLDDDRDVVLCYPRMHKIDERGQRLGAAASRIDADLASPAQRFSVVLRNHRLCEEVFGLVRRQAIVKTRLIGNYAASDHVLLCELCLRGRFKELPQPLFLHRIHESRFTNRLISSHARSAWFDPQNSGRWLFPNWRLLGMYIAAVRRSGIHHAQRRRCYSYIVQWASQHRRELRSDFLKTARRIYRVSIRRQSSDDFVAHLEREAKTWRTTNDATS